MTKVHFIAPGLVQVIFLLSLQETHLCSKIIRCTGILLGYVMEYFRDLGIVNIDKLSVLMEIPYQNRFLCLPCPSKTDGEEDNSM